MADEIDQLLNTYQEGRIDRRQLLAALLCAAAAPPVGAQSPEPAFRGRILNHVTVGVSDVATSRAFYQSLLGATIQKELPNQVDLRIGDSFVTVLGGQTPGIMHFCVGVAQFDGDAGLARLQRQFAETKPRLVTNELDQKQIILRDPDGVTVEIADVKYRL